MFAVALQRVGRHAGLTRRAASSAPSVYDKIVSLTVVDLDGRRHVLRGLEGQTVADVLSQHADELGEDAFALSPAGSDTYESHVKIPSELFERFPAPSGDAVTDLEQVAAAGTIDSHSRLASAVTLDKSAGSILVALGGIAPWRTI